MGSRAVLGPPSRAEWPFCGASGRHQKSPISGIHSVPAHPYDSVMAIDIDRLTQDLRQGAAYLMDGNDPIPPFNWGMARAWLILASAIGDGEYDLDPRTRTIADLDPAWDRDDDGRAGEPA